MGTYSIYLLRQIWFTSAHGTRPAGLTVLLVVTILTISGIVVLTLKINFKYYLLISGLEHDSYNNHIKAYTTTK